MSSRRAKAVPDRLSYRKGAGNFAGTIRNHAPSGNVYAIAAVLKLDDGTQDDFARYMAQASNAHADLVAALVECEDALTDYIPKMERRGDILGYGHKVLTQARAALAAAQARP